jgi:hypothetical protein
MGHRSRKGKTASRVSERRFPFIVQIEVPETGFGLTIDAINAWHRYTNNKQQRARPQHAGRQKFGRWCFARLEIAEKFRGRFGGEIVPARGAGGQKQEFGCELGAENALCGVDRLTNNA